MPWRSLHLPLAEFLKLVRPPHHDVVQPRLVERVVVEKFDKTHVYTPGVEGLIPFETLVLEDGRIVDHSIHPRAQEGGLG